MLASVDEESIEDARRILTLLCCAKRPLTVPELIDAVALELGDTPRLNPDGRLFDEAEVLRICPGFVEIDSHPFGKPATVSIAHYSVQEYLESNRICEQRVANFSIKRSEANSLIASICLTYLIEPKVTAERSSKGVSASFPLTVYAAQSWYAHFQDGDCEKHNVQQHILRLFQGGWDAFKCWVKLWDPGERDGTNSHGDVESPVYYAALLGLDFVIASMFSDVYSSTSPKVFGSVEASAMINMQGGVERFTEGAELMGAAEVQLQSDLIR